MKKPERLERVGVRFPPSLTEQLDEKAKLMDCSRSVLIRRVLSEFMRQAEIIRLEDHMAESADAQFRISVEHGTPTEGQFKVTVESNDPELPSWKLACEYFMRMTAERSGLGFDEALCQLCEGAHKYETKILRLHR